MAGGVNAWDRQPGETPPAFRAFAAYRDLGPGRSIAKAAEQLGRHPDHFRRWSAKHHWRARIEAFEAREDELQLQRIRGRRRRALDRRLDLSDKVFEKLDEAFEVQDASKWRAGDLARVLAETAKLEDSVIGGGSGQSQHRSGAKPLTADDFEHLTDEEIYAELLLLRSELDSELADLGTVLARVPPEKRDLSNVRFPTAH